MSIIFQDIKIANMTIPNRIVRSATYEGMADRDGFVGNNYLEMYETLAKNHVGLIITGFAFISNQGRAMQQNQAGIDNPDKVETLKKVTDAVHKYNSKIILQIAHTGRQTIKKITGEKVISTTNMPSIYFRQIPKLMTTGEIERIIEQFANSAYLAKLAGFDGVQIHSAHGYLIHQSLLCSLNKMNNKYGIDKESGIGTFLLNNIIDGIRNKCGNDYPILIKISGDDDFGDNFFPEKFHNLIKFLDIKKVSAIEISYGTMDYAINIFRGKLDYDLILKNNPLFKSNSAILKSIFKVLIKKFIESKAIKFKPMYNLEYAKEAKKITDIPIITVGGFRTKEQIENTLSNNFADMISLSRPFLCEPDFVLKLKTPIGNYRSKCTHCNKCVFMCDSGEPTRCRNYKVSKFSYQKSLTQERVSHFDKGGLRGI